jgi:uncharacterized membrane protein
MMGINVLVTGLWMGGDEEYCKVCNYDVSWLFNNPSTLIWADKIILTPFIKDVIDKELYPPDEKMLSSTIRKVFELAEEYNLIEVRNPNSIITEKMWQKIDEEVDFDRMLLAKLYPDRVKIGNDEKVPGQIFIQGEGYCAPRISSIYISLILAKAWNARCLFDDHVLNYCRYKFGLSTVNKHNLGTTPNPFDTIFNIALPKINPYPNYIFHHQRLCKNCSKEERCSKTYLNELEDNLSKYLAIREYDEIAQLKATISKIIKCLEKTGEVNHDTVVREFKAEERRITRTMRKTFPKIHRWTSIALIASAPAMILGAFTGLPTISSISASLLGLSQMISGYVKYMESKYKWIGFINRDA